MAFFRTRSLGISLKFSMIMIVLSIVLIIGLSSILLFDSYARKTTTSTLRTSLSDLFTKFNEYKSVSKNYGAILSSNAEVSAAIESKNAEEVLSSFRRAANGTEFEFVTITDERGIVIARTHSSSKNDDVTNQANVKNALKGTPFSALEPGTVVKISARTGYPVRNSKGDIVGVISVGFRADNPVLLQKLKDTFSIESVIYFGKEAQYSTLTQDKKELSALDMDDVFLAFLLKRHEEGKEPFAVTKDISGRKYLCMYRPVIGPDNKPFAHILAASDLSENNAMIRRIIIISAAAALIIILVTLAVYHRILRVKLMGPLADIKKLFGSFARGELDAKLAHDEKMPDELSELCVMLEVFRGEVSDVMRKSVRFTEKLSASAADFERTSQNLAESTQSQSASIEESSAALEEIAGTTDNIAANADDQARLAEQTLSEVTRLNEMLGKVVANTEQATQLSSAANLDAERGRALMQSAISGMKEILSGTQSIAETVSIISDISDQVNLLSLNASIEAARAGEHGKGFAVVAEEISKLADQTSSSAKVISDHVQNGIDQAEKGNGYVNATSDVLASIISSVSSINGVIKTVSEGITEQEAATRSVLQNAKKLSDLAGITSSATGEQMLTNKEMIKTIDLINEMTQTVALNSQNIASMAADLSGSSEELQKTMAFFKL